MDLKENLILTTAYFPPVQYFAEIVKHKNVFIEIHENYLKQSYRNRCIIYSANGPLSLVVPVKLGSFHKISIRDLRIDNSRRWQTMHLRAMKAAYSSSAFYEFFTDELAVFFNDRYEYLLDLNSAITLKMLEIIGIDRSIDRTDNFCHSYKYADDFRYRLHPKKNEASGRFPLPSYFQVFGIENGFIPNMSILDLIFNMGPESYSYLKEC
ncbi:MAG TPA: WbqC family protein [Bacteroidales bacterium]|nr:WbqC family protein [Bacteroidales bacterium]